MLNLAFCSVFCLVFCSERINYIGAKCFFWISVRLGISYNDTSVDVSYPAQIVILLSASYE